MRDVHGLKSVDSMDLNGDFVDGNGAPHSINPFTWALGTAPSLFHVLEYSNDDDYALAQNDPANATYGGLYSKLEWTTNADGEWFYCHSTPDAMSIDDAKAVTADRDDLLTGCNANPWTSLTQNPPVKRSLRFIHFSTGPVIMSNVEQRSDSWNTALTIKPGNMDLHISPEQLTGSIPPAYEVVACSQMDPAGTNTETPSYTPLMDMDTSVLLPSTRMDL